MRQLIINLDDKIKTLFVADNVIIDVREFVRSTTVLDKLYSMISGHHVNQVIIITHNILSMCMYENICVAFDEELANGTYLSVLNYDDTKKLVEVCNNAGAYDIQFVDALGYYIECGKKGVAYIDYANGIYRALSVNNGLKAYSTYAGVSSDEWISSFATDNNLSDTVKGEELLDTDYLMVFSNGALIAENENLLKDLALFGFSILCDSKYKYDSTVLERNTEAIIAAEETAVEEIEEDIIEEGAADTRKPQRFRNAAGGSVMAAKGQKTHKPRMRKEIQRDISEDELEDGIEIIETEPRKNTKAVATSGSSLINLLASIILCFGLCGAVVTAYLSAIACPKLDAELNEAQMLYNSGSARVSDLQTQIQLYQNCNSLESIELLPIYEIVKSTMPTGSTLLSVDSDSISGSTAKVRFLKEDNATKYLEELKAAGYTATVEPIMIEVDESGGIVEDVSENSQGTENTSSVESRYVVTIYLGKLE